MKKIENMENNQNDSLEEKRVRIENQRIKIKISGFITVAIGFAVLCTLIWETPQEKAEFIIISIFVALFILFYFVTKKVAKRLNELESE